MTQETLDCRDNLVDLINTWNESSSPSRGNRGKGGYPRPTEPSLLKAWKKLGKKTKPAKSNPRTDAEHGDAA